MTATVETAVRAQAMRESAAALADPGLSEAVEGFMSAHAAASEALSNLSRAQISGPDSWPQNALHLVDEAGCRWDLLATGWAKGLLPPHVREAGDVYARTRIVQRVVPLTSDWESSIGVTDWSRGR